jgi:DNA-directed RNA polymerase subunit M/transcription elongation factor TFIIS
MPDTKAAGRDINSYCGKCRLNLDHTIMAMDGEEVSKVRCKSCGSTHKFRDPLIVKKVRKPRVQEGAGEAATAEIIWAAGLAEAKGKERDYSMSVKYRIGDIVNHQTFGKGIVMKLYANKCDMLFKDRQRLMASTNE